MYSVQTKENSVGWLQLRFSPFLLHTKPKFSESVFPNKYMISKQNNMDLRVLCFHFVYPHGSRRLKTMVGMILTYLPFSSLFILCWVLNHMLVKIGLILGPLWSSIVPSTFTKYMLSQTPDNPSLDTHVEYKDKSSQCRINRPPRCSTHFIHSVSSYFWRG